jgi:signal transduction histidine kinase
MLLAIEDLTHLKQLERELVRAEKLSTMGILAAGIAHEIGTPLGVVRARAEMLAGKFGHDAAAMRSILAIIEQSDAISGIISRVLEFTRSRPMETKLVGVGPACREAVSLLRERFEAKQVSVDVDAPDELPLLVADPQGFRHVILNLLRNACDACAKGGEVHVVATLDPDADAPAVTLAVSDNGCGIAREHLHSIFDPFFTTKKGGEGTGLGLAIAQDIVKNHNGTIAVESTPGQGSRFAVRWPARERTAREERGTSPATSATSA